jgi:hypothetical protein
MAYDIKCRDCETITRSWNVVDLFRDCTNEKGRFVCSKCEGMNTFIYRSSDTQEGDTWERWIKGVIRIDSGIPTYSPYIFLTADSEEGPINGLHFNYYKDTRTMPNGKLKHGHGPGGAPVLAVDDLFTILHRLVADEIVSKERLSEFAKSL